MATQCPPRASVRDLLIDLLGQSVTVRTTGAQVLDADRPSQAVVYRRDDGEVAAVAIFDQPLVAASGAAIGRVPPAMLAARLESDRGLYEEVLECFEEVGNVHARLLNGPAMPHVAMRLVHAVPGRVPRDVATLLRDPRERTDYLVVVEGYPPGALTFLVG